MGEMSCGNLSSCVSWAGFPLLNEALSKTEEMLPPKIFAGEEQFVALQREGSRELDCGAPAVITEP